jgi:hypothetical protein
MERLENQLEKAFCSSMSSCARIPKRYPAQLHSPPLGIEPGPAVPIHMLWFGGGATKRFV